MERYIMKKNCNLLYTLVLFFMILESGFAQYSPDFIEFKKQFPEDSKIGLQQETIITIEIINKELVIKQEFIEEDLYLDESASFKSKETLSFSSFFELDEIKASTLSYDNGKYNSIQVKEFSEKDNLDDVFYDDTKLLSFVYPRLKKGSKSRLIYSQIIKNPRFLTPFYFGDYYPVKNNKVTIIADKKVELDFKNFNLEEDKIKFSKVEKRKKNIYTWQVSDQKKYDFEPKTPSVKTILPHVVPIIKAYTVNKKPVKVLGEVSDLYNWYYSLVENVNTESPDQDLVNLVKEITANKSTDLEKVKAIYYWTQKNIKYIAFEYALGGFVPRESNEIFSKRYGDCKDNSSILYKMLEIAGIEGNLTWIGTRKIPYNYEEVPTPIVDNHMILSYEEKGKTYYLDATGRYVKLGMPTSFIQGKEALVSYGKDFKVKKVPVVPAKENAIIDSTFINLKEDGIVGRAKSIVSGYPKINIFHDLENENSKVQLEEMYNVRFRKGNNKFLVNNIKETNKYSYDKKFIVDYDFEIKNYTKKLADEIYINLNLNKEASYFKTDKKRKYAIEYSYKKYFSYTNILELPEEYAIDYLPENINVANDFFQSTISYKKEKNTIIYNHQITLDALILSVEQQKKVNQLIKEIEQNYKEIVVLKKK